LGPHEPDVVMLQLRQSATLGLELDEEDPAVLDEDAVRDAPHGR
jgi:hypothetical protein